MRDLVKCYFRILEKYIFIFYADIFLNLESFEQNYFEQLCINYVNEKIHQMFVKRMLKDEEDWYATESLEVPKITFLDNSLILGEY